MRNAICPNCGSYQATSKEAAQGGKLIDCPACRHPSYVRDASPAPTPTPAERAALEDVLRALYLESYAPDYWQRHEPGKTVISRELAEGLIRRACAPAERAAAVLRGIAIDFECDIIRGREPSEMNVERYCAAVKEALAILDGREENPTDAP